MKKFLVGFLIFLVVLCLNQGISWCNSPPLIMQVDTAFPISSDNIKLESEVIKIHYDTSIEDRSIEHEVEVVFNFYNIGPETELDIGFPNMASYAQKLRDFQAYDYPSMTPYATEIKDGGYLPEHEMYMYNSMYTWKMHFKENEKKSLYVNYKFVSHVWGADYILITGALWKDRIDKIDVYVDFSEPAAFSQITASPSNYYYNGKGIEWHFENIEPDFNLFVGLSDTPKFYDKKDDYYKPRMNDPLDTYKWDDCFYLIYPFASSEYQGRTSLYHMRDINYIREAVKRIKNTNQFVINEIYARHGYEFKSDKWREIFEESQWYYCNSEFSPDMLNDMEKATIDYIKCFNKIVVDNVSDEELKQSLKEFEEIYNGKNMVYGKSEVYPYYQYTFELVSAEKERIDYIDQMNKHALICGKKNETEKTEVDSKYLPEGNSIKVIAISEDQKSEHQQLELYKNGIFLNNGETMKCVLKYLPYQKISDDDNQYEYGKPLESYPQIYDDIKVSPNGKYMLVGTNYELDEFTGIVGNKLYLVSIDEGLCYILGYGDSDDFKIWWSPSENMICWQDIKKEPGKLKFFDIKKENMMEFDLPYDKITSLQVMDDGKIVSQIEDTIFYMNSESGETNSTQGTVTAVLADRTYFYKDNNIYYAKYNEFEPVNVNRVEHSIWKSKAYNDDLHLYYGGAFNLTIFNARENKLNRYKFDDYHGIIKPSPMGDKLFIYRDYSSMFSEKLVKEAIISTAGIEDITIIDGADSTALWLDNDNLLIKVYDEGNNQEKTLIAEYCYNVETGKRTLLKTNIKSFKSRVVKEFETEAENLTYGLGKEYSKFKYELKANAFTTSENTIIYRDQSMQDEHDVLTHEGSLVGILEIKDGSSKVCYIVKNYIFDYGWIKNTDYTTDIKLVNPSQGFIYNTKIYEFDGEESRQIFDNCSSQVNILDRKLGWVYINAVDRIFGWVREEDMKYGFLMHDV